MQYNLDGTINKVRKVKVADIAGWLGMACIHGATVPVSLRAITGGATALPPLEMVLMIWAGLALFLLNAVANKNTLYIVSNGVGFALQTLLLTLIVF